MMTKKDFIALADTLRPIVSGVRNLGKEDEIINALALFMKGNNPLFNETRWRDYLAGDCGPSGGKSKTKGA